MKIKNINLDPYISNKNPVLEKILTSLFDSIETITQGKYTIEPKASSLHIVAKSAFLGIHFLNDFIRINVVLNRRLDENKIYKVEQVSKSRFHNEINLKDNEDINEDLKAYIKEAYQLKA
ncbi:MAG: DUF5655 domain-containing protein [Candidatus Dojkabacteria bacterium]